MKIFELINTQVLKKRGEHDTDAIDKAYDNGEEATSGSFAHVEPDPEDPHMVVKKSRKPTNLKNDSYYQYVRMAKPFFKSNPFLPRVYEIDVTTDKSGKSIPNYRMERLYPYWEFNDQEIAALAKTVIPDYDEMMHDVEVEVNNGHNFKEEIWEEVLEVIDNSMQGQGLPDVQNPLLQQAVEILRRLQKKYPEFFVDMHENNAMIRRTSVGPQLVITDPIAHY